MSEQNQQNSRRWKEKDVIEDKNEYENWSVTESEELVNLLVDAHHRGWRNASGKFDKKLIESRILLVLNAKLNVQKTYNHYVNRMKTFKRRYDKFTELKRFSSGFGFDPISKRFTAPPEVWDSYIKSHPNSGFLRTESFDEYEYLEIIIGGGTCAMGGFTIGSSDSFHGEGSVPNHQVEADDTDHRSFGGFDGLMYDESTASFTVGREEFPDLFANASRMASPAMSPNNEPPPIIPEVAQPSADPPTRVPAQRRVPHKRSRSESTGCTSGLSGSPADDLRVFTSSVNFVGNTMTRMGNLLAAHNNQDNIWPSICEVEEWNLETRYLAMELLSTRSLRNMFACLTPEERKEWLKFKLRQKE